MLGHMVRRPMQGGRPNVRSAEMTRRYDEGPVSGLPSKGLAQCEIISPADSALLAAEKKENGPNPRSLDPGFVTSLCHWLHRRPQNHVNHRSSQSTPR